MVRLLSWLLLCWASLVSAGNEPSVLDRLLFEQNLVLANQTIHLKVSLATRNIWQHQGLLLVIDATTTKAIPSLSAQLLMSTTQSWQGLSVMPEAEQSMIDSHYHYRWQAIVFPKQLGVQDLPSLRLRLEGAGGAQKTISLPSLSVYVRSLPVFVPAEAWVGKANSTPLIDSGDSWVIVADQQVKTWQWRVQGLWSQTIQVLPLSGSLITGLQPWVDVRHEWVDGQYWTTVSVQQPWFATNMGHWYLDTQDIWLFDPQTGKVQHWQLDGIDGFAVAQWVWKGVLGLIAFLLLTCAVLLVRRMICWLHQHQYRLGVARAADAYQLLRWLRLHWQLSEDIPIAHQAQALPISAQLIALEALLFSSQPLYDSEFKALRDHLLQAPLPACSRYAFWLNAKIVTFT